MIYLFLNSISTGEVIIILAFVLMFFGSKGVPGMARSIGKGLRQLRDATDDIKRDIRHSVEDIEKSVKSNMDEVTIVKDISEQKAAIQKNIDNIVKRPSRFVKDNIKDFAESVESVGGNEGPVKKSMKDFTKSVPGEEGNIKEVKKEVVKEEVVVKRVKTVEEKLSEGVEVDDMEEVNIEVDLSKGKSKKKN